MFAGGFALFSMVASALFAGLFDVFIGSFTLFASLFTGSLLSIKMKRIRTVAATRKRATVAVTVTSPYVNQLQRELLLSPSSVCGPLCKMQLLSLSPYHAMSNTTIIVVTELHKRNITGNEAGITVAVSH